MKYRFTAKIESPGERSVFHFQVRELGVDAQFDRGMVVAEYEGTHRDKVLKELTKLYESQPVHLISIST